MNSFSRRIAAGLVMVAAPALVALGGAAAASAATGADGHVTHGVPGPTVSHPAFPHQHNTPKPGTPVHHHHQQHRWS